MPPDNPPHTPSQPPRAETDRITVRIFPSHNAAGTPEVAECVQVIHHRTANTLGSDAMQFLRPLSLTGL